MNAVISKLREFKSEEQLAHLYVDSTDTVRDRHIEDMFRHLYTGKPLDDIFRINFGQYHQHLTGRAGDDVPPDVFANVIVARSWVARNYGLIHATAFDPAQYEHDPELADMRYTARLASRYAPEIDSYCYAPTELGSILLTVVNVYRSIASDYIDNIAK